MSGVESKAYCGELQEGREVDKNVRYWCIRVCVENQRHVNDNYSLVFRKTCLVFNDVGVWARDRNDGLTDRGTSHGTETLA